MAKTDYRSVDDYIAAQPEPARTVLQAARTVIRRTLPDAEERISYQLPAWRLPDGFVIYLGGWKKHWSLYPAPKDVHERMGPALAPYEVDKGTIRFPLGEPIPADLVEKIVTLRAADVAEAAEAKAAARKTR